MVYNFLDKKSTLLAGKSISDGAINTENISNKKLGEELHKPVIEKSWERKTTLTFYRQYLGFCDFCDMQLMSKFYKGFRFLLCVINTFSKYAWVMPLKDKREITITNPFQKKFKWIKMQTK